MYTILRKYLINLVALIYSQLKVYFERFFILCEIVNFKISLKQKMAAVTCKSTQYCGDFMFIQTQKIGSLKLGKN